MNRITRKKDTDILTAWDADNNLIAIAGHVKELLEQNILLEIEKNADGWLIIPMPMVEEMGEGIVYSTRDKAKEVLRSYKPV